MDEEAFLYLNFNETPQPSLRELEKMVQEIKVSKINEEEEEKKREEDTVEDRENGICLETLSTAFSDIQANYQQRSRKKS